MRILEPPRFLVDENLSIQLAAGVLRCASARCIQETLSIDGVGGS